uniref:Uncharacterized protein n=1 Tax=Meloidogyne enterolobii TaxID=390850 RepID=A0A6V7V2J5_MELEN|nr:unnamed protein product [Meloidogyne enterolobii]
MHNLTSSRSYICKRWVSKYPNGVFTTDGEKIFCQACSENISCSKITQLEKHIKTFKHIKMLPWFLASKNKKKPVDTFYSELCSALNSAGIPLAKVNREWGLGGFQIFTLSFFGFFSERHSCK